MELDRTEVQVLKSLVSGALGNKRADWSLPHMAGYRAQLSALMLKLEAWKVKG